MSYQKENSKSLFFPYVSPKSKFPITKANSVQPFCPLLSCMLGPHTSFAFLRFNSSVLLSLIKNTKTMLHMLIYIMFSLQGTIILKISLELRTLRPSNLSSNFSMLPFLNIQWNLTLSKFLVHSAGLFPLLHCMSLLPLTHYHVNYLMLKLLVRFLLLRRILSLR